MSLLASSSVLADRTDARVWRLQADAGAVSQFAGSFDAGGDFESDRFFLRVAVSRRLNADWTGGISLEYGEMRYDFSGGAGFAGLDPWDRVRQVGISTPLRFRVNGEWTVIAIPTLRYLEERGAQGSSSQAGLLAAAAYRVNDRLTVGPGFGVYTGLEEDADFFPVLFIDWKLAEHWRLETGRGLGASRGPGVSLKWQPGGAWTYSLGARYEKWRFRLDESGPAPGGIGEDRSVPVGLAATYAPTDDVNLTLLGGVELAGSLKLEDRGGHSLTEDDYDPAPFVGVLLNIKL